MKTARSLHSAAFSALLLGLAAACSSTTTEPVASTAGALAGAPTWVDGNVLSFKAYPAVSGLVYVLGTNGNLWREQGTMATRTLVDGNVSAYQPIDGTVVYVLGTNGNLWREVGSMSSRTLVASGVHGFQVSTDGTNLVYYVDAQSQLWLINGSAAPTLLATEVLGYQYVNYDTESYNNGVCGAALYVLRSGGLLWRAKPDYQPTTEVEIGSDISSFYALNGLTYFAETTNSYLWHVVGPTENEGAAVALVDTNVELFRPLNSQTTFVEDNSSNLWREQFSARDRMLVDTNVEAYEPIGPGQDTVYVLHKDGNLWLESLADPLCQYSYLPRVCPTTTQNATFVAAWGVPSPTGACPNIPAAGGTWIELPANDAIPNDTVAEAPTCAGVGIVDEPCCLYVWSSTTTALADPSVLCTPTSTQMTGFDVCGRTSPSGGATCPSPGGGGCPVCNLN